MNLFIEARKRYLSTIAADLGVQVIEDPTVKVPHAIGGKTIKLPPYPRNAKVGSKEEIRYFGNGIHEALHCQEDNKKDFDMIRQEKINVKSLFGMVHNCVIDHNIEFKDHNQNFRGRNKLMDTDNADFYDDMLSKIYGYKQEDENRMAAVFLLMKEAREEWNSLMAGVIIKELSEEQTKFLEDIRPFKERLLHENSAEENFELAKDIYKALGKTEEDFEEEKQKGKGEEESSDSEEGDGSSSSKERGGKEDGEDGDSKGSSGGEINYSELLKHAHGDKEEAYNSSGKIIYDTMGDGAHTINDKMEIHNVNAAPIRHDISSMIGSSLSKRVRRLLLAKAKTVYEGGKRRGKIKSRNLHRLSVGDNKIFQKKQENINTNTSIFLFVDQSGSMNGTKYTVASAAAIMMSDVLTKLNIKHAIAGFTEDFHGENALLHYWYKQWNERPGQNKLLGRFSADTKKHNNADGESIMWAFNELVKQDTHRKILIVFSDGYPEAHRPTTPKFTQEVIHEIENKTPIEIYGIGIQSESVRHFYKEHKVIHSPALLEEALFNVISTKLTGDHI